MRAIIFLLTAFAILWTGIIGTMTSVLMQSLSLVVLTVCCFLTSIHAIYSKEKPFRGIALVPFTFTMISATYFLSRALLSEAVDLGIKDAFLVLSALSIYILTCYWGRERLYCRLIIGSVIVLVILNLLNFIPYFEQLRDQLIPFSKGNSSTGLYNHRNFLSNFLMMSVLLLLSIFICYRNNKLLNYFCLLLAIIGVVGIYLAKSRGGYIGLMTGISILGIYVNDYYLNSKKSGLFAKIGKVAILLCVLGVVGKLGFDMYHERTTSTLKATELGDRLDYFAAAIDQVPDAFLFGSGSMSYSYKCYLYWGDLDQNYMDHVWVHNEFLQALTDYGLIGLLFILGLIMLHIWNAFKHSLTGMFSYSSGHSLDKLNYLRVAGVSMIIGSLFDMLFSFPAHSYSNIMLMAFACSWMTFKDSDEFDVIEPAETKKIKDVSARYLSAFTVLLFSILSLSIALPQLKAATIFSQYNIYDDSTNWSAKESMDSGWLPALEQVVAVAPTHLRYERLSSLYMERAAMKKNRDTKPDLEMALLNSKKALDRHPYDTLAMANQATCLFLLKRHKEADYYYAKLQKHTASRQKYFKSFVKRAHNLIYLAEEYYRAGLIEEARSSYAIAFDCCINSSYNKDEYSRYVISLILSSRTDFLIKNEFYPELDQMFLDFSGEISGLYILRLYPEYLFRTAEAFIKYADLKFSKREPEIALKWYVRGMIILQTAIPYENGVTIEMINTLIENAKKQIIFLESARIIPAK